MQKFGLIIGVLFYSVLTFFASAATITWTNTTGGNWSETSNWDPNQVPGNGDAASITVPGTYAITIDSPVTVDSLFLGATTGTQTITINDPSFYLFINGGSSVIDTNGVVNCPSGTFDGGPITLNGKLNCHGGSVGEFCRLHISPAGTLHMASSGADTLMGGAITNEGTITIDGGAYYVGLGGGYGWIRNLSGGILNLSNNVTIIGAQFFDNEGLVNCSGQASTISCTFNNSGTIDVQSGTLTIAGGGSGNGAFIAQAGTTLDFNPTDYKEYTVDGTLSGAGTNIFEGNEKFWLNGTLSTSNAILNAPFGGTHGLISGNLLWIGGWIEPNSVLTIATNGTLTSGDYLSSTYNDMMGTITNNGTIKLPGGTLRLASDNNYGGGLGLLINNGVIDFNGDGNIDLSTAGPSQPKLVNFGTIRKSGYFTSGFTEIYAPVINKGIINPKVGTMELHSPNVDLSGGTLDFSISERYGYGRLNFPQGVTLAGSLSATLDDGNLPVSITNLYIIGYSSLTGSFDATNLPSAAAWDLDYDGIYNGYPYNQPSVILTVLNGRPILAPIANNTVNPGQTVSFTASATDHEPSTDLNYSLQNAPVGASIVPTTGVFTWRPTVSAAGTSNYMQVVVTDNSAPVLSDTKSFAIVVNPLQAVTLTPLGTNNSAFAIQVTGTAGPDYILSATTDLLNWSDICTNASATPPFQFSDINPGNQTKRFYKVRLSP